MKDYYQILEVTAESGEDAIRKSYRRLAMLYHPDRNPDKPGAEEKFKEIAEAYGVLTDPVKRRQYDAARTMNTNRHHGNSTGGFNYSQEDILRDLFQDPRFHQLFAGLLQEFQRRGLRANERFVQKSFFGNRGGLFFSGLFFFGSLAGPALLKSGPKNLPGKKSLLRSLGTAVGSLLGGPGRQNTRNIQYSGVEQKETTYTAYLSAKEFRLGKDIQLVTRGLHGQERLKVKIPPGSKAGQKLRLRGKGIPGPEGRGDLFLSLQEKS
jgi:curved DNA-binding protein